MKWLPEGPKSLGQNLFVSARALTISADGISRLEHGACSVEAWPHVLAGPRDLQHVHSSKDAVD